MVPITHTTHMFVSTNMRVTRAYQDSNPALVILAMDSLVMFLLITG
jgi:hypothetical protein